MKFSPDCPDTLLITKPTVSPVSDRASILLTRKLLSSDGSFAGIAMVSIDPHYLSRFYHSISIGQGSIILGSTSGTVLARVPEADGAVGGAMPPALMHRISEGTIGGSYRVVSSIDNVERIYSPRLLPDHPLIVAVGLATADVFARFERNKRLYCAVGGFLSVTIVAVGLIMARQRRSLIDSRQALSVTLDHMSQGIAMVDAAGNVQVLNRRAIDLLGLPRELVESKPTYRQIVDWQFAQGEFGERETWDTSFGQAMRAMGPAQGRYTYARTRPNGTILEVATEDLPGGGFVRTFTDITERKRNEAALATAQSRAAHAERTQVLGQLAVGIAHDFNNILQAVQGGASLINLRATDPASVRQFANRILDTIGRGTSITGRLLAFARREDLQAEPIDARELLTDLREVLVHTLGSPITIDVSLDDERSVLVADKGQLETVLINLATNARDAMPRGGTLRFSASPEVVDTQTAASHDLQAGRYIRLSIADTGSGMDTATLAQATEPFFSTKPPGRGTGLGLSMAKRFLAQSGGALSIDSVPGQGTTVRLWVPAAIQTEASAVPPSEAPPPRQTRGERILLVDDEAMVRETLAAALEDIGYVVLLAASGSDALDILASAGAVDVLVTDLSMPVLDGLALIREARSRRPRLPAVLLTGYAGPNAQLATAELLDEGFSLVRKPVTAAQLAEQIEGLWAVTAAG